MIRFAKRMVCVVWCEIWNPGIRFSLLVEIKRDRFLKVDSQELVANNVESHKDRHRGGLLEIGVSTMPGTWSSRCSCALLESHEHPLPKRVKEAGG